MIISSVLLSFFLFGAGMFTILNGPLWFIGRVGVFVRGRQAPEWLQMGASWLSRLIGLAILITWARVSTGVMNSTLLLGIALASGLFCLLDGPTRLVAQCRIFHRSREAPARLENIVLWIFRIGGAVTLLATLAVGTWVAVT